MYTVIVTVDTNDGDCFDDTVIVSDEKFMKLTGIFGKIKDLNKKFSPRIEDYDYSEFDRVFGQVLNEDELDTLKDIINVPEPGYATLEGVKFFFGEPGTLL